ncbi:hypothetical protein [Fusobacterium ulcerans]|uniref:hypothetical protein n=1 Tax=Fusobacterium ulcerans TaxID=861 RepID=UPI001D09A0EC|nr:hypothetical protein [Fusobacterium ulcerans]MCB8564163.1 hypothetical protein [Fusobacterium ulcerans]MCB8648492.1 hypothetical protein [Fusobacterium ulcerans]
MKKIVFFIFINLFNLSYATSEIEKMKKTYEYILGEAIWSAVIGMGIFFSIFAIYYFTLILCLKKNSEQLFEILKMENFENRFVEKEKLSKELEIKKYKNILLFLCWVIGLIFTHITGAYPFIQIIMFCLVLKKIFYWSFPDIPQKNISIILLGFFVLIFLLGLGNVRLSPEFFKIF